MIRQARCRCSVCRADARANLVLFLLAMGCVLLGGFLR